MSHAPIFFLCLFSLVGIGCNQNVDNGKDSVDTDNTNVAPDADGDGFDALDDCNDNDASIYPNAVEICDGIDNDCDKAIDEDVAATYYADTDQDGFGNPNAPTVACDMPDGFVPNSSDCDDADPRAFPSNVEVCDGIDNNCDGMIDEGLTTTVYLDSDSDGFGDSSTATTTCEVLEGYVAVGNDCDDTTAAAYPGAEEICDEIDNDCDGSVDEDVTNRYYADTDRDGYGDATRFSDACSLPVGYVANDDDCDDSTALVSLPRAWYQDSDSDGFGNVAVSRKGCAPPAGYVGDETDCDDQNLAVNPNATELCNFLDDDCDGSIDEDTAADAPIWYVDADGDGYGDLNSTTRACTQPPGYVASSTDCDDASAAINPAVIEICNMVDDNCDGFVNEGSAAPSTWYLDYDRDGYGDSANSLRDCNQPNGYVWDATDCDDTHSTVYPGAYETCDTLDNDCNGFVDDGPNSGSTYFADSDGDGTGDPNSTIIACTLPSGYAENSWDCNDADATEPVVADRNNGSTYNMGTLDSPLASLQSAIDLADSCVIAFAGQYIEDINLIGKNLDVWGVEGAVSTVIDADLAPCGTGNPMDCGPTVKVSSRSGATPLIHGFTIRGGTGMAMSTTSTQTCADSSASHAGNSTCTVNTYEYCGGGVYIDGDDPTFVDVVIEDNTLPEFEQAATGDFTQTWLHSFGGGVCVIDATPQFEDTYIIGNYADQGGGIYVSGSSSLSVVHSVIMDNDATDGAGALLDDAAAQITNTIIGCNDAATDGGGFFLDGGGAVLDLVNAVLFEDASATGASHGAAIFGNTASHAEVTNSILITAMSAYVVYGVGTGSFTFNDVYNTGSPGDLYNGTYIGGVGSTASYPNFVSASCDGNPYNDDFNLRQGSVAIDAGNPSASFDDVDGTRNDMGAFGGPDGGWTP